MDKTYLEKSLAERAHKRTLNEFKSFVEFLNKNEFGRNLSIKINGVEYKLSHEFKSNRTLLEQYTNIVEVEENVFDKFLKEEINSFTEEVENITPELEVALNKIFDMTEKAIQKIKELKRTNMKYSDKGRCCSSKHYNK